ERRSMTVTLRPAAAARSAMVRPKKPDPTTRRSMAQSYRRDAERLSRPCRARSAGGAYNDARCSCPQRCIRGVAAVDEELHAGDVGGGEGLVVGVVGLQHGQVCRVADRVWFEAECAQFVVGV